MLLRNSALMWMCGARARSGAHLLAWPPLCPSPSPPCTLATVAAAAAAQTLRAYVGMLRMADGLWAHPTYLKVRRWACAVCCVLCVCGTVQCSTHAVLEDLLRSHS